MAKPKKQKIKRNMKMSLPLNFIVDEQNTQMSLEIDIPGVIPDDVKVTIDDNVVVVAAKRLGVQFEQRYKFNFKKYDPATVEAEIDKNVLQITLDARPDLGVISVPVSMVTGSLSEV